MFCGGALARQPELFALGWSPRVTRGEREIYEIEARREGWPNFEFSEIDDSGRSVRARDREEYFPIYYIEPRIRNGGAIGVCLDSANPPPHFPDRGGANGPPAATPPV